MVSRWPAWRCIFSAFYKALEMSEFARLFPTLGKSLDVHGGSNDSCATLTYPRSPSPACGRGGSASAHNFRRAHLAKAVTRAVPCELLVCYRRHWLFIRARKAGCASTTNAVRGRWAPAPRGVLATAHHPRLQPDGRIVADVSRSEIG